MNFNFIGLNANNINLKESTSLLFRRTFFVKNKGNKYTLKVIGLGIGVYKINSKNVTDGVLLTPFSDYTKTIYYDEFDVTNLIKEGTNIFTAEIGNGFFNESINTVWNINKAKWRGNKCLGLVLECDGTPILESDNTFKVTSSPFTIYNELRAGEIIDFNNVIDFNSYDYDDSSWLNAEVIKDYTFGELIKNELPLIKEVEVLSPVKVIKTDNGYIYDFARNISGYIECCFIEEKDKEISFRYAEDIKNNKLELHGLDCYQKDEPFQLDKAIANGKPCLFKPKFTYHGFRYVEVSNITNIKDFTIKAIFVHEDIKQIKPFPKFDNDIKQKIFNSGIASILSNCFYSFTDCPTREKLFWLNDMQASMPLIMEYYDVKSLLKKVVRDIVDAQDEQGNVPGIAPSPDWGYEYGPICGFAIMYFPYLYYKKYNDKTLYNMYKSNIIAYYNYLKNNNNKFILGDWTGSQNHIDTPIEFVMNAYLYMYDVMLNEIEGTSIYLEDLSIRKEALLKEEIKGQAIPSFLLVYDLGDRDKNLDILLTNIKNNNYHIDCGMFGTQFIYKALSINNLNDVIDNIVLNENKPSFRCWIEEDATTLYESFDEDANTLSMNHHMFSNILLYLK